MASNYEDASTDLDNVLAPYHPGWPQAGVTNINVAGVDIRNRYAPLSTGSAPAATGYNANNVNLKEIFAAINSTGVQVSTQPSNVSGSADAGNPSGTVTSGSATCSFTKGSGTYSVTWYCTNCTANSPNSTTTSFSATVNAGSTDNASAYCNGSDGVTSVNTNTIAVTLTNTTPAEPVFSITAAALKDSAGGGSSYIGFATNHQPYYGGTLNSEAGFLNGCGLYEIFDDTSTVLAIFGVSGLSSDPLQGSLTSVTINGVTLTGSSATSYTYGGGYAQWEWHGSTFNLAAGTVYNGSAVRNGTAW